MRAAPVCVVLLCVSVGTAQVSPPHKSTVKPFTVTVDQPAYAGEPIWVHKAPGPEFVRYPFSDAVQDFGCSRLELLYGGKPIPLRKITPVSLGGGGAGSRSINGPVCGSAAPSHAPENRLPLHVLYSLQQPGIYAVRWIYEWPDVRNGKLVKDFTNSGWTTFTVSQATTADHERWLSRLLANSPTDPGLLAGDYLPSLLAAVPDERALQAIAVRLYSSNLIVSALAASELGAFPRDRVRDLVFELLLKRGPTDNLAQLVSYHAFGLDSDPGRRAQLVRSSFDYLRPSDPAQAAAAIKMIRYIVHLRPNQVDSQLAALADSKVLQAAPAIIAAKNNDAMRELSLYLEFGGPDAHLFIWQIAESSSDAANQARNAILFHPEPGDLGKLEAMLLQSGNDSDPNGMNLAGLPRGLMGAFGDNADPTLRRLIKNSPYVWVRTSSAKELLQKNDPAALHFFLDALINNRWSENVAYKRELIEDVQEVFPKDLSTRPTKKDVVHLLRERLSQAQGGS